MLIKIVYIAKGPLRVVVDLSSTQKLQGAKILG
jgi:hypothetical protein